MVSKPVVVMAGGSLATWLGIALVVEPSTARAVLLGMFGPLVVTSGTWTMMERTFRRDPARLTTVMVKAFGGKLVFFGAYVAAMLKALNVPSLPFVVSFTSYFIGLYMIEALYLQRLFAGGLRPSE